MFDWGERIKIYDANTGNSVFRNALSWLKVREIFRK